MSVKIIVDSTTDLPASIKDKFSVVPLSVFFGEQEFVDGVSIDHRRFYEMLIESDVLPTTSQPTPEAFAKEYRKAIEAGQKVVVITISSKLSGTFQSATIAAMDFPSDSIYVVDSNTVAIGTAVLAQYALALLDEGLGAAEIANKLTQKRKNIRLIALLDTLEYLKRGGRISKTVAFAGGILSIKPVISIEDGEIKLLGKARGSKQGNNLLVEQIKLCGGVDFQMPLLLGYTGLNDELLKKYIDDSAELWQESCYSLEYTIVGSVVGTHAGPGAIAVAFFNK